MNNRIKSQLGKPMLYREWQVSLFWQVLNMLRILHGSHALQICLVRPEMPCERFKPIAAAMCSRSPYRSHQKQKLTPNGRKVSGKSKRRPFPV